MNRLLVYIVSYQRKEYTQGNVVSISKVLPEGGKIIVCDNGSTDGTREWLTENQERYDLGLLFPEDNLRVGGAWTLLTNYFKPTDFDYILLLDNDGWIKPQENWFNQCLELFGTDDRIGSLGLVDEREKGHFGKGKFLDPNFNNQKSFNNLTYYDTVFYAAFRLDKFDLWHQTMSKWPHKFIGDKIGRYYNSIGFRTLKLTPGFVIDISEYNFDNKKHFEYNKDFHNKERDDVEFEHRLNIHSGNEEKKQYILDNFGEEYIKLLQI